MFRSLYAKLALVLLGLVVLLGILFVWVGFYTNEMYLLEVRQKLNQELASHLVDEGLLLREGEVDPQALEHVIHMMMVINPNIEVYVLDPAGTILGYSTPPGKLYRETVDLGPVREFLSPEFRMPLLGDDPRDPGGRKVFSAAAIGRPDDPEGYVYVVLGGQLHDSVVNRLEASYALRMGVAAAAAALLFALAAGLLLFALLTRRLGRLATVMKSFEEGGFSEPPAGTGSGAAEGDEIDRLGSTFRRMAGRIVEQMTELEDADRMRRELVANVSHDLRTPLASLHGYLETLVLKGDRLDPEERDRYLGIATRHSGRLGKRVADLFELAKLDACEVKLHREKFSIAELVQDVIQKFHIEAGRKRIRLHTDREKGLPFAVADIGLVERVLENLIGNAVRHTPEGGQVTVSVEGYDSGIRVQVRDTGPGIAPEEKEAIFDRFYRGKKEGSGNGGTGLGLAIARRIVDLHGGTIEAGGRPGEGAVFTFTLP